MAIDWGKIKQQSKDIEKDLSKFDKRTSSGGVRATARPSLPDYRPINPMDRKAEREDRYASATIGFDTLGAEKERAQKSAADTGRELRLSNARENLARRAGFPVNGISIDQERERQSSLSKDLQGYRRDIERIDYIRGYQDVTREDNFGGQFRASYDVGQMGQDEAMAWKDYLSNPTPQNRLYAEAVSKVREDYIRRNQDALDDDATLPWISQDLAQYLPQLKGQTIAGAKGALGGAAVGTVIPVAGTAAGAKAGYVAGRAAYGFDTMQGFAFKSLLDAGLDEQTAREAAMDEAFISSLIEGGDAAIDLLTLGGGKVISALFKKSAQTGAKITKPMWKQILSGGAAVLGNALGEGIQEWTQEGVSIANQKRGGTGLLDLAGASVGQMWDAAFGGDTEALAQMNDAGAAGFRIGLMVGGGSRLTNAALERAINRQNGMAGSDVEDMASTFGPSGSRAFTNAVENGAPATGIYSDFVNAYNSGLHGREMPAATSDAISAGQMQAAYYAGQNDAGEKGGASRVSERTADDSAPERQADLLEQLRQQGGTITNRQAERLMDDQTAMETLRSSAGLNLSAQDTMSKRRDAVKQAFARYARENAAQPAQETVQAKQAVAGEQVFDYAKEAGDVLRNGIFTDVYGSAFERTGISYSDLDSALTKISRNEIDTSDPVVAAVMSVLDGTEEQVATASGVEAQATKLAQNTVGGEIDASLLNSFGENGRKAFANSARNSTSPEDIYPEFSRAYVEGLIGAGQRDGMSEIAQAAYYAGQNDAEASLAAEREGVQSAAVHGNEAVLVDNDLAKQLPARTAALYNTLAKAAGVKIELVDQVLTPDGKDGGNGLYDKESGTIRISVNADGVKNGDGGLNVSVLNAVVAHEITHRIQSLAPEEYRQYRDYAMNALSEEGSADDLVELYKARHAESWVELNTEQAMDEIAADFTRNMLEDAELFRGLARENRSLARRVLDALRNFISKVKAAFSSQSARNREAMDEYGVSMDTLEKAAGLWQSAYDAAAREVRRRTAANAGVQKNAARTDGTARFSIRYDQNNKPYVVIEEDILAGVPQKDWVKTVKDNLRQKFPNGVTVGNNVIEMDKQSREEMTYSRYTRHLMRTAPELYADKLRATNNADEILRASRNYVNEALAHPRRDNIQQFARGEVLMQVGGKGYSAQVVVAMRANGKLLLYDILQMEPAGIQIKNKKSSAAIAENPSPGTDRSTASGFTDSIAETGGDVNGRFSLKGTGQLQRQVQNLEERNRYLQEQLKRTKGIKTDRKKTASFARNLLTAYESQYDRDTLTGELLGIYDEIANSRDGVDMDGLRTKAREVAERVLEQSVRVDAEVYNEYSSLRNYLRTTRIKVPKSIHADLEPVGGYNGFRRGNSRRLKLSTTEGMDIDTLYRELSQQYPGLFDEQAYTNPADQLINISDVLESIQPVVSNPYSSDMEMAARFVANEILEGYFDVPQQRPTFADRQEARVEAARAAGNRRLTEQKDRGRQQAEKLKDRYEQRIAQLRQQGREQVQNAISRERKRRADQVKAIKEKYTSRDIAARKRRNARELRNRIQRHVQALSTRLLNPTDSRNVPEALRRPVAALLEAVNLESNYSLDPDTLHEVIRKDGKSGGITGKRLSRDDGRGAATKRTEAFRKLREQYLKIAGENGDMVIDPALFGDAAEGIEGRFDTVIAMEDIPLAAMNTEQLTAVWKVVKAVEHSVSTAGKTLSETKYEATKDWALALERDTASRKNRRTLTENGVLKSLENPYTFFSHYGEAGHAVYRMLRNAQDRQQLMKKQVEQEARNIADPKTVKRLEETVHTFTTERGDRLTLSTAQVMELYELMKREQAHNHLLKGGIVQPAIRSKKIRRGTDAILLSGEDLGSIVKVLSDEEITIADGLQKLTAGPLADYGNEASMAVYGYKKFTGTDYWPIQPAKEGVKSEPEKGENNTRSIKNIGLARETVPHASNALDLPGIFDTFAAHSADMLDYAAWLAPMEDANRLFNYKYRDENGSPTNRTVKGLLERVGGSGAQKYWSNLMEDIQNGIALPEDDSLTSLASKGIGSFKGAAVGGNVRVVIQQPTAFFRAGVVLSPADLTKGLVKGVTGGSGWQKALQYSPIAMRKNDGSFDISNPATMKEALFDGRGRVRKFNDALSAPAGMADAVTWGRLWNACEWATAREHKGLRAGSEAFYRKVNELFTEVIDQTQVVDGVLQRSNIMRSRNTLAQQATSFMGEPIMSLNIFLRAYDQMRYEQDAGKRGKAKKRLGRAVTALLVTNVVNALAQSLVDAMRDDDEDKKYWERFRSAFTGLTGEEESAWDKAVAVVLNGNMGSALNPAGQIPYVRDVLSLAQGYDVARTDMAIFSDLVRAAQTLMQSAGGNGPRTRAYAVKELISSGAKVFGTPVGNLARDIFGFARSVAVQTDNIPLQFEMEKAVYNITNEKNKGRYYDILFRALRQNDMDSYFRMQRELMDEMGVDGEQIAGAMRERLKKAGEEDPGLQLSQEVYDLLGLYEQHAPPKPSPERFGPDDLEADAYRAYSQQSAADFRTLHDRLKTMDAFAALPDEEKDNALDAARALAESTALRDYSGGQYTEEDFSLWERWAEMGEGYGVDETEAILFRIAYDMTEGDPDEKGNTVSGSKKENVLEAVGELMPWLTDAELEYLKTLYWTPEDKALKALKEDKFLQ